MWERLVEALMAFWMVLFGWASVGDVVEQEPVAATSTHAVVTYVIDGDTFDIDSGERVRLFGIDTPERDECYFDESTDFVRAWLEGQTVRLEQDVRERDVYGRLLRYVFIDREPDGTPTSTELLVNDVLLQEGYAEYLPIGPDRRYRLQFRESYEAARASARGLFGACE